MPSAYAVVRGWYAWRRPTRRTVAIAVWCGDHLVFVTHTYKSAVTLPGGGVRRNETPVVAAARELREETGIIADPATLRCVDMISCDGRYGARTTWLFELALESPPPPQMQANGWETADVRLEGPAEARVLTRSGPFAHFLTSGPPGTESVVA